MKTKLHLFLLSMLTGLAFCSQAQVANTPNRGCGTGILPQQFESWLQTISVNTQTRNVQNQTMSVFNIPVIVHVIHNNEALNSVSATSGGNLNAAQIQDQINILNRDYNGTNTDTSLIPAAFKPFLGKFQFNFCLAVVNPTGGVMPEPGIDRVNAASMNWTSSPPYSRTFVDATIKPATIWNPNLYMNMWVCSMSGGILGYATFPNPGTSGLSGLSAPYGSLTTDGLVMLNSAFGSIGTSSGGAYNLGRTATHEIGHWLGLRHVWGDGNCLTDYCDDTPYAAAANYGCQTYPYNVGGCTGNTTGEMTMNYMDYGDDACIYMFTKDQKNRAQLIMTNSPMRATLLTSTVCNLPTVTNEIGILFVSSPTYSQVINCNNFINPVVTIHNSGSNAITSATFSYNIDGATAQTFAWTGSLLPGTSATVALPSVSGLTNGAHGYNVGVYLPNGATDPNPLNNTNNQQFSVAGSFNFVVGGNTAICPGGSAILTASGTATGYTWSPGGITFNSITVMPSSNTVYTVTGSNGTCVITQTVMVTVGSLSLSINASSASLCGPGTVTLSTPNSLVSYTWSTGTNSASTIVSPVSTTTYVLTGYDGACTGTAAITISVAVTPTISISANPATPVCAGGSATLTASGAGTFLWNTGATTSQLVVSPSSATDYTVTGTDSGCSNTATVSVAVGTGSIALLIAASPSTVCAGGSSTLTASGASSYTWNTGSITPSIVVSPSITTVYSFDGSNGSCLGNASVAIIVISSPTLDVTISPSNTVCLGNTATLTASGTYSAYTWSHPTVTSPSIIITPTATTIYTVSGVGGSSACSSNSIITVYVTNSPVSVLTTSNSNCSSPCSGIVNASSTGGTPPYTYSVSGSSCTSVPCANLCPALYTIRTIDANGCSSSNIFSIANSPTSFAASISGTNASCSSCADGKLKANVYYGSGPYSYTWAPSGNNSSLLSGLAIGCYTVTVRDTVGCVASATACVDFGTGLTSVKGTDLSFLVYPNPAKNAVTIEYNDTPFNYTVYNHLGQLILSHKNNRGSALVDLNDLASGIYLIEVDNGKDKARKKLIVE